ncbi:CNPPD1 [Cordylochernes scorpioides]|uniref:Protein CNPPD1 n=1 Tax=Cordylochernes scorpioides TaxID=51811 RepID=A0ABY6JXM1_9ARAC|nr:CNPPD1 [Cordylochernes scorpioides]
MTSFAKIKYSTSNPIFVVQVFKNYHDLTRRLKKTCYYGKHYTNTPSLPFSLIVVEFFNQAAANEDLKKLDLNYVTSVSKGSYITPCSIVLGMMYVEQLLHNNPDYLHKISPNELFLVSMMVASKFINESEEVYLGDFAVAGKQTVRDLTSLEREFLRHLLIPVPLDDALPSKKLIILISLAVYGSVVMVSMVQDWKLNAPPATVADWLNEIEYRLQYVLEKLSLNIYSPGSIDVVCVRHGLVGARIVRRESSWRGWHTYTDLLVMVERLAAQQDWTDLLAHLLSVSLYL